MAVLGVLTLQQKGTKPCRILLPAAQAQAAADKHETDYAAAVAAFQKQITAQNAVYLASLGK